MSATRRSGRRPGESGTREAILAAARRSFGSAGFVGTTIRGVARTAGVDPALVHHYFGTKDGLFSAALELPFDPTELVPRLLGDGPDGLGERVVRTFLGVWDSTPGQGRMLALLRSAVTDERAAGSLRDFLVTAVMGPMAAAASPDRAELRATLVASQMVGLAMARYVLRFEPLASAGPDQLAPALGATIDAYLTGPLSC
ncbi:MAG: TetR/AcrR family transcriptional regulator [Geodermatophilaceae bacterium]|nr:TetR/AcrR family transcriptional regulator [Geodermatophilaceae bacterium]